MQTRQIAWAPSSRCLYSPGLSRSYLKTERNSSSILKMGIGKVMTKVSKCLLKAGTGALKLKRGTSLLCKGAYRMRDEKPPDKIA
ncbi:hypothetical protein CDAR_581991 [Caerostris darwini]|uniref:Uncharacterized protein n=1 Tax=Caerostris darwini TaxID=1538125 RepID=A0AAV4X4N6_9ARAC|nr:hypothetical protein CDAR_581991 [Caerostris darwini]